MRSARIARLARESFLEEPLMEGFTDIRKKPVIALRTILMSLYLMPFFSMTSLLSNDRMARTKRYRRLFSCRRKMVASDSTFARVLGWLKYQEVQRFLLRFLKMFEQRDMLRKRLCEGGRLRRLGVLDGSYMGGHWQVTLCLPGKIAYPVMLRGYRKRGKELEAARELMRDAPGVLGKARPELWLLDALYFNTATIEIAREQQAHVLFKFKKTDLRTVTKDAQNLFEHYGGDEEQSGFDTERLCRWWVRKTEEKFHSEYPVQVVELVERYVKRKQNRNTRCWIVSTDLELSLEEIREAAHQRWQVENNVFKRISHLSGTKRFYFRDPKRFFTLLHILYAGMAMLDYIMALLKDHPLVFAALRGGIKPTWRNVCSQIQEVLYGLSAALVRVT